MNNEPAVRLYDFPKVGRDALAYCTRCRMELAHVIVSMVGLTPSKVVCKTCKSQHNFRRQSILTSPGSGRKKAVKPKKTTIRVAELWQKKVSESKAESPIPYQISATFVNGSLILHSKFGVGIVEQVKRHGKISVLFREGEKVLIHERKPAA